MVPPTQMNLNNRGFFDLNDNFIFDYVYDPTRSRVPSGGFASGSLPPPSRPQTINGIPRPSQPRQTTTRRPFVPPSTPRPFAPPQQPAQVTPRPQGGVGGAASQGGTTQAPSIFHSSDYDYDLDDVDDVVSNRFGAPDAGASDPLEIKEPNKCSWAITNCCAASTKSKKERCFQIFRCKKPVEEGCTADNVLKATLKTANFLNSARKK